MAAEEKSLFRAATAPNDSLSNKLTLRFLSRSSNVAVARLLVTAVASARDTTVADLDEIKVAVSEAVSNAIIHGYEEDPDQYVEMSVALVKRRLIVTVHDDGKGIEDIEQAMRPDFSSGSQRMGLGFAFMQSFMDEVEVSSLPGAGTTVTLSKELP